MLQLLHKILSVIIAFIVFFSSLSFTVEKHICMGEITAVSYFGEVDNCGMQANKCDDDYTSKHAIKKKKCCDNILELTEGNQNEQQAITSFDLSQVQFATAYLYTYLNLFETNNSFVSVKHYLPPLIDKNIQALYQTFII